MRRLLHGRDKIIDYIGMAGGFPVLDARTGEPGIRRPDDDESGQRRVGWREFFAACEARGCELLVEGEPSELNYRFLPRKEARRELGLSAPSQARQTLKAIGFPIGTADSKPRA